MKERFLEVIEYCIVLIVAIIEVLFMMVLTPFYPFIYIITGKNIYKKIKKVGFKTINKIGDLIEF